MALQVFAHGPDLKLILTTSPKRARADDSVAPMIPSSIAPRTECSATAVVGAHACPRMTKKNRASELLNESV